VLRSYVFPTSPVSYAKTIVTSYVICFLAAVPGHRFCRGNFREERAILIQDGRSECQHLGTFYERYSVRSWSSFHTCFFFFIAGFASRTRLFFPILSFQLRWSFQINKCVFSLFAQADAGAAFDWRLLVDGFWFDCDTAIKARATLFAAIFAIFAEFPDVGTYCRHLCAR
jgi:hypothetical protein